MAETSVELVFLGNAHGGFESRPGETHAHEDLIVYFELTTPPSPVKCDYLFFATENFLAAPCVFAHAHTGQAHRRCALIDLASAACASPGTTRHPPRSRRWYTRRPRAPRPPVVRGVARRPRPQCEYRLRLFRISETPNIGSCDEGLAAGATQGSIERVPCEAIAARFEQGLLAHGARASSRAVLAAT